MFKVRGLHVLTDREMVAAAVIAGGAAVIQLRDKKASDEEMIELGKQLLRLTKGKIPLIVDDRVNVALVIGADGVHVGQKDMPAKKVRRLIGRKMILGVSAHTVREAIKAEKDGADYIGVGPVFATQSKKDAESPIGLAGLKKIKDAVSIPVIAIGGITVENAASVIKYADGLAVISAVLKAPDPKKTTQWLRKIIS